MKILIYSYVFFPKVGGVETVSQTLAEELIKRGIQCKLITETPAEVKDTFPFEIWRQPDGKSRQKLADWADLVLFNGASLAMQLMLLVKRKPFVWIHVGYQVSCIDGLGWVEGIRAPLRPFASMVFHARRSGIFYALKEGMKLFLRNFTANYLASGNIAITHWMQEVQPLNRQEVIYNPFPLDKFKYPSRVPEKKFDFLYAGRLVSEKGVGVLLKAFRIAINQTKKPISLLIIGDGNRKTLLEKQAKELEISEYITFAGRKTGQELVDMIYSAPIAIVPSEWYEPMGGVALELLTAGRALIISEKGGLKECAGAAGIAFPNGDYQALAACMLLLWENKSLQEQLASHRETVLQKFQPDALITQYMCMFQQILNK